MAWKALGSKVVKVVTTVIVLAAIVEIVWVVSPYVSKTQTIYQNIDILIEAVNDMHDILNIVSKQQRSVDSLGAQVSIVSGQNKVLNQENKYLREMVKDAIVGSSPYDSIWWKDDFGQWNKLYAGDYLEDELYKDN